MVEHGGRARFGMDDGYLMGPMEVIFRFWRSFAVGIKEDHGCQLNARKCKMYNMEEGRCEEAMRAGHIPESLPHVQEGIYVN